MRDFTGKVGTCYLFCKVAQVDAANAEFNADVEPDNGGDAFIIECNAQNALLTDPITHRACECPLDAGMDTAIRASSPTLTKYYSADGWTMTTALADMFLQIVPKDEPPTI